MRNIVLTLVLLASSVPALGAPNIPVSIVYAKGPHGVTKEQAMEMFYLASWNIARDTGVQLAPKEVKVRRDISKKFGTGGPEVLTVNQRHNRLDVWAGYFARRRDFNVLKLVILPPLYDGRTYWFAGISNGICTFRRMNPIGQVSEQQRSFHDTLIGATAMAHELGHLLGAQHDPFDGPDWVMCPDSLARVKEDFLHFSPISISNIKDCTDG